ncbi:hypothetical protein TRICI_000612 [Trichomonascus ciferrii]|uniref:Protein BZZ1 n=1 Tax=Trichomonascus ciferrii TaxID=44093 RepID=A0A642VBQ0_9ASCO|nr:hypothetical protein TRICI_000612 [Trichomonascus ciferrii]
MSTTLSVGETPQITPGSLENASLVTWTEILNQTEQLGKEKQRIANEFGLQIADQVHGVEVRYEELRKRYATYNDKLVEDRDNYYSELKKAKSSYDSTCQTMENQRMKASKSFDRSKEKANRKMEDKEIDMNNKKNVYLIKLNVANRLKEKYYHEDVPELLDGLQQLNEARVTMLNMFWNKAVDLEKSCYQRCIGNLDSMAAIVAQNKPSLDSAMFAKHNIASWNEPPDFLYEPSPIWHDDENMIVNNDAVLQFLRKRLSEASRTLDDKTAATESRYEDLRRVMEEKQNASPNKSNSFIITLGKHVNALQALTTLDTERLIQQVEVETIELAANGKDLSALPEPEKKKRGFLGLGKKRHHKPQTQQQAANPDGGGIERTTSQASSAGAASVNATAGAHHATSFLSSLVGRSKSKKTTTSSPTANDPTKPMAKALYGYTAQGDDELNLEEGQEMNVLEPDDGSGWANVQIGGQTGLVPAAYIETVTQPSESSSSLNSSGKKKGPAVAPKKGAKKVTYMIALYDYDAQSSDELTIRAGDKIVVISEDQGDGWTEGELNAMSGMFPTAYAKLAS